MRAHGERVQGERETGVARGRAHQRAHRGLVRREHLEPAHQHVEQTLTRGLFGHLGIAADEHRAIGLFYLRGEDREGRRERGAQIGKRDIGGSRNLGETDALDRLFGEQRHEHVDDALALGFAAARCGSGS